MASAKDSVSNQHGVVRQLADYPKSIWADRIAAFTFEEQVHEAYSKEIEMLKTEVLIMLSATDRTAKQKFDFIDKIERLGISYHFGDKIESQLQELYDLYTNSEGYTEYDLFTTALQFRLFRQHGFNISCGIFNQFIDASTRKFKESLSSDTRGLLSLYEASQVRTARDSILEEALAFTTTHLKNGNTEGLHVESQSLAKQVKHALDQPLHKSIQRYDMRQYISMYEEDESNNKLLLRLAKLDYHLLQMLHKWELAEILRWGKEMEFASKFPYARERLAECYFWALATFYEPQYSLARMFMAKAAQLAVTIDDVYDSYGTLDELKITTDAFESWNGNGIDQLSDYMKNFYLIVLNFCKELEEDSARKGKTYAFNFYQEEVKRFIRGNFIQSKWFLSDELPSFADYLSNGLIVSAYYTLQAAALLGMDAATKDVIDWMSTDPKIVVACATHARLINDVGSYKFEKERSSCTGIDCYMKEYNVSEEEAMDKFEEIIDNAWKTVNEECLGPATVPREILKMFINLSRACEVAYKNRGDAFTNVHYLEVYIKGMVVDPIIV